MQVDDLDKVQLVDEMKISGVWKNADMSSPLWKRAFKLYQEATGVKLDMSCNKCFQKVLEWLQK